MQYVSRAVSCQWLQFILLISSLFEVQAPQLTELFACDMKRYIL